MNARRTRVWAAPLLVALAVVAVAVLSIGRFLSSARGAVVAAEAALARGDQAEATRCYLDALRSFVPGSPFEGRALDGLEALAHAAADAGDDAGERRALEAIRAGLLGTRSLFVPQAAHLAKADRRLAELNAAAAFPPAVRPPTIVEPRARGWGPRARLRNLEGSATLTTLGGLVVWVGAVVVFIRRGLPAKVNDDVLAARPTNVGAQIGALILFVVGFALFLVGLRLT